VRELFLVSTGVYSSKPELMQASGAIPVTGRFSLAPNRPIPVARATTIQFERPVASRVRLDVFDLGGRRVATLTDGEYAAGYHGVHWDPGLTSPGIYLYRIQAGTFRDQKKMILLP